MKSLQPKLPVIHMENMVVILFCQIMTLHSTLDQNRRVVNAHLLFLDNSDDLINCFCAMKRKSPAVWRLSPKNLHHNLTTIWTWILHIFITLYINKYNIRALYRTQIQHKEQRISGWQLFATIYLKVPSSQSFKQGFFGHDKVKTKHECKFFYTRGREKICKII